VPGGLGGKGFDDSRDLGCQLAGRRPAVKTEVERDLVVARPAGMQRGPSRSDLCQPSLDRGVNVLVGVEERERAFIELTLDPPQSSLDCGQLIRGQEFRASEGAGVREASGDVEWIELEIGVERRREALELDEQAPLEATTPELGVRGLAGYFPSRLTSPSRLPSSRACRRPCTWAEVRTPIPHSLMKPAAAD
jgi:hypothetical protein